MNSNGHLRDRVDVMKQSGLNGMNVSILLLRLRFSIILNSNGIFRHVLVIPLMKCWLCPKIFVSSLSLASGLRCLTDCCVLGE